MSNLTRTDTQWILRRTPKDVRDLMRQNPGKLFMGGGFIRAAIAGETPSDIDMFGVSADHVGALADLLAERRKFAKVHKTDNAITIATKGRLPVQFITRWAFNHGDDLVESFDFTVCQAAIWYEPDGWKSSASLGFYPDLAARRLVYTEPERLEDAGGSMMRVIKYLRRGYSIQADSLGSVIDRLMSGVTESAVVVNGDRAAVITGLLREVDPLLVIDGDEVVDEHEPVEGDE